MKILKKTIGWLLLWAILSSLCSSILGYSFLLAVIAPLAGAFGVAIGLVAAMLIAGDL